MDMPHVINTAPILTTITALIYTTVAVHISPSYERGLTLIPTWTSNHMPNAECDVIIYPSKYLIMDVITYVC